MIFREATTEDIEQMQIVRNAVKENALSNPDLVPDSVYEEFLTNKGKGWVCEINNQIVGFAIVDLKDNNIWALFVLPEYENQGIGKQLQKIMLDLYFSLTKDKIWLGTDPNTRAEKFYQKSGWKEAGTQNNGEIKFEMTYNSWLQINEMQRK